MNLSEVLPCLSVVRVAFQLLLSQEPHTVALATNSATRTTFGLSEDGRGGVKAKSSIKRFLMFLQLVLHVRYVYGCILWANEKNKNIEANI